ncbi:MAG: hypothetical protein AB2L09_05890 [Coriobacteriia bacterium]
MKQSRSATVLVCVATVVLGFLASLFLAGPALFADGDFAERLPVLAISIAVFLLLGVGVGVLAPFAWKPAAICLAISAVPVVVFLGLDTLGQAPMTLLAAGFLLGDAAAGVFGAWLGARLRGRFSGRS